jgi:hypothetical protein
MPADLKAALSPAGSKMTAKPVTVAAHVSGKPAAELVAQIDSDKAAAKKTIKPEPKSAKAKSKAQTPKAAARKHTHKK